MSGRSCCASPTEMASGALARPVEAAIPLAGLAQLGVSVLLLSSAWPLTKLALLAGASPPMFALGRAALSTVAAACVVAALGRARLPGRADLPALFAIGGLQIGLFFILVHEAVSWVPAGRTAILANTTTVWIVPLSLIVLRERIPRRRWVAAALGLGGIVLLVGPWSIDWRAPGMVIGHAFLLAAALSWAIAIVVVRRSRPRLALLSLLPWCFLLATVMLLPMLLLLAPASAYAAPMGQGWIGWAALGFVGLLASPIGTWCIIEATAVLPAMVASVGFLATPAVGLGLSSLLLGEALTPSLLAGAALILSGVACAAWPARPPAAA